MGRRRSDIEEDGYVWHKYGAKNVRGRKVGYFKCAHRGCEARKKVWRQANGDEAVERDGVLYGRGVLDTKGLGIIQLEAFLALHRSGMPLRRDVIYMATADEEAGGYFGAGWLIENRPEIFDGPDDVDRLTVDRHGGGVVVL